jgi:LacI family transcriptional regulator
MRRTFNILVGCNHTVAFDRRAFMGIATLANERHDVRLFEHLSDVAWATVVRSSGIHGIIAARLYAGVQNDLNKLRIPFVSLADVPQIAANEYVVAMDETAIGSVAARYFLDAGYRHFAVCIRPGLLAPFGVRVGSFANAVGAAGRTCVTGPPAARPRSARQRPAKAADADFEDETSWAADAAAWIAALPKPLAVFAPYDYHARVVVNVAQQAGLRVPDDVAVVGVDDDEVYCMTTSPQLSSVVTPGRQVGQVALSTLLKVLQGERNVPKRTLIRPPTVLVRGSSSDFALQNEDVIAAVRFIREHAAQGVRVDQVADRVLVSRRTLERRFMTTLSHTVRDEIQRAKINLAKRLLIDTDLPYRDVARRSGIGAQQRLNRLIKSATGQTPVQFRAAARQYRSV